MIENRNGIVPKSVESRIKGNIKFTAEVADCWEWAGCRFNTGYGCIAVDNKQLGTHRLVWEMHNGVKIPEGLLVRHSCDNRSCCNPYHLSIGTVQDNSDDMVSRNRQAQCQEHGRAKITDEEARQIVDSSEPYSVLAKRYGLSKASICRLKTGRGWRGLGLENTREIKPRCKLDADAARAVYSAQGLQKEIAERFGITQKQVSYIKSGRAWGKATADLRGK